MRVTILAGGRAKDAPESRLAADYLGRAEAAGRRLGLGPFALTEIDERRGPDAWAARLAPGGRILALDERGEIWSSAELSAHLARWRDAGEPGLACLIGGADGLDPSLVARAHARLAFGRATWPHLLVRVMLAEQLYRAVTILTGHPYHRA